MQPQQPPAQPQQAPAPQPSQGAAAVAHEITHGPSFAMLRVDLQPGQTLVAEAGSMVARHDHVAMDVKMNAGPGAGLWAKMKAFVIALIRRVIGGETFFVNHFSAPEPGSVWVAPTMSGQLSYRRMQGETLVLSTGAYVASVGDLDMKMKFGGLKSLLAKEGAFFLAISGHGDLWFNSYGGIEAIDVNGPYTVDNGHLVGYEGNLDFDIRTAGGGLMGFIASGEGMVCEFKGQGRVYIQSRNTATLVEWLTRIMPS
ncbi:MAG TPA: TIGR00266 family protein [Sandaracinaceae bacterium LLY-WYZ-13_1]|nr:TIGR00266 family protein [Sandaracinaceae bacterium LLY-WYZ-13_1]